MIVSGQLILFVWNLYKTIVNQICISTNRKYVYQQVVNVLSDILKNISLTLGIIHSVRTQNFPKNYCDHAHLRGASGVRNDCYHAHLHVPIG